MIQSLQAEAPIQQLCEVLDCPGSTYYYQPIRRDEADLVAAIDQVLMRRLGYRGGVAQLKREGVMVGETVARRLLRQLEHTRSVGQVQVQTTNSNHPYTRYTTLIRALKAKQPNQVWVADITYLRLETRFLYWALILHTFSRAVRGWALSRSPHPRCLEYGAKKGPTP
jgi:transposase InsO family protein